MTADAASGTVRPGRLFAAAAAGAIAGVAYLAAEAIDNRISGRRLYDLLLLARPFVRSPARANALGAAMHLGNSVALGTLYAGAAEPRLPGPPAAKGITFLLIENTMLYPLLFLERWHLARKADEMGSYWSFRSYLWSMPRHVAFGAVLGSLYPRLRDR
jgi:hypothetical protein